MQNKANVLVGQWNEVSRSDIHTWQYEILENFCSRRCGIYQTDLGKF